MGAAFVSDDLPPGFVLAQPASDELPPSFVAGKKKFGLGDTWPARLAKDIYSAVTLPGDVAQGNVSMWGEDGHTNPEVIGRSAELAQTASPVSPAARMGVGWAGALKTKDAPAPTQQALETASDAAYKEARGMPFEMDPAAVRDWAAKTQGDLTEAGRLQRFAPDTHSVLNDLQAAPDNSVVTGSNLVSAREALREASRNFTNPREKGAAERAIRDFDEFVARPPKESVMAGSAPAFAERAEAARRDYAALKRSEQIAEALRAADLSAGSAHSGQNLDNATRQRFRSILLSDKNSAGYSEPEIAQMERVVKGSTLGDTARFAGKLLGGGGGLGALHAAATGATAGFAAGGPIGAAIGVTAPAVGFGLNKLANALTNKEVRKLDELVRARSALGDSLPERGVAEPELRQKLLARYLMMQAPPITESAVQP
jgi:hypothetical protein